MFCRRCIFLETVAGVPGFAAGMMRHLQSLRKMERDHGWIHTLLEEAENERMHLMTFMQLRRPGIFFRGAVISTQIVFTLCFCLAYSLSPRLCHRSLLLLQLKYNIYHQVCWLPGGAGRHHLHRHSREDRRGKAAYVAHPARTRDSCQLLETGGGRHDERRHPGHQSR